MNNLNTVNERIVVDHAGGAQLITAVPKNKFLIRGEPGIGKTALAYAVAENLGYELVILDVAEMMIGDAYMPIPNHERGTVSFYPNEIFRTAEGKPCVYLLDEYLKGSIDVQRALHPMLEPERPRIGNTLLPEGSVVILTSNLDDDNVGDSILSHTQMRLTELELMKPRARNPETQEPEWLAWAHANGCHPVILAVVNRYPDWLASYRDANQENNPVIFNPARADQGPVVCPRTLMAASNILHAMHLLSDNELRAGLAGVIGLSAADTVMTYIKYQSQLPRMKDIYDNPMTAKIPENETCLIVLVFQGLAECVTADQMHKFSDYLRRTDDELENMFWLYVSRDTSKQSQVYACGAYTRWCRENSQYIPSHGA